MKNRNPENPDYVTILGMLVRGRKNVCRMTYNEREDDYRVSVSFVVSTKEAKQKALEYAEREGLEFRR